MKKTILITGATSGIGLETVKIFLRRDWQVIATYRDEKRLALLSDYVKSMDLEKRLIPVEMDLGKAHLNLSNLNQILEKHPVDVLVNNAGFAIAGAVEDTSLEELRHQFEVNFFAIHKLISLILPHMRKKNSGSIVNISSMGGRITFPFFGIYNASKHALESYTEALWMELRSTGIKVYLIEPGLIETNFFYRNLLFPKNSADSTSIYQELYKKYRLRPQEIAFRHRSHPRVVAQKIYDVATDQPRTLRHPVGKFAGLALYLRKFTPDEWFNQAIARLRS